jgi:hypothetical protein
MAITLPTRNDGTMEFPEFLDKMNKELDVNDPESIAAAAQPLRDLANNRRFMVEKLNQELFQWRSFQGGNGYTAPTFLFGGGVGYAVRANVWGAYSKNAEARAWQDRLFVYGLPHDHNFDFLTVGYYGPGYQTDLYEYDRRSIVGIPGERVELIARGREQLYEGRVMHYRASRDIHTQLAPESFSVSLNLMVSGDHVSHTDQFYFDIEAGTVRGYVEQTGISTRAWLCEVAQMMGDEKTMTLLHDIASSHPCSRTRVAALSSIAAREPSNAHAVWKPWCDASDRYLRTIARTRSERC